MDKFLINTYQTQPCTRLTDDPRGRQQKNRGLDGGRGHPGLYRTGKTWRDKLILSVQVSEDSRGGEHLQPFLTDQNICPSSEAGSIPETLITFTHTRLDRGSKVTSGRHYCPLNKENKCLEPNSTQTLEQMTVGTLPLVPGNLSGGVQTGLSDEREGLPVWPPSLLQIHPQPSPLIGCTQFCTIRLLSVSWNSFKCLVKKHQRYLSWRIYFYCKLICIYTVNITLDWTSRC